MKRSNHFVLVLGLMPAAVALEAILSVGAPRGTVARSAVKRIAVVRVVGDLALQVILGVSPQQAELIGFAQLDDLSLLLRSPQDAASADTTTIRVTQRRLVDEHGGPPPRVALAQLP